MQIFCAFDSEKRPAEHGEVLRENVDEAAVDLPVAGDEAVAVDHLLVHAEVAAAVADQLVQLTEGAFVEQQFDALARGQLAFLVLPRHAALRRLPREPTPGAAPVRPTCARTYAIQYRRIRMFRNRTTPSWNWRMIGDSRSLCELSRPAVPRR